MQFIKNLLCKCSAKRDNKIPDNSETVTVMEVENAESPEAEMAAPELSVIDSASSLELLNEDIELDQSEESSDDTEI